jgi:ribosomal peptide maturation radical SAM protein 1
MPFGAIDRPALGISTLKARLQEREIACDVVYPSLAFAALIGRESYQALIDDVPYLSLACEWVFASSLFGHAIPSEESYVADVLIGHWQLRPELVEAVRAARATAPAFLDGVLGATAWADHDVVGFSTVGQQNTASLALAQRIRWACPRPLIVFGGHCWEGPMGRELLKQFPFVDLAFSGEADASFPAFLHLLEGGRSFERGQVPGLTYRVGSLTRTTPEPQGRDEIGVGELPDFRDYFEARRADTDLNAGRLLVPVEASRGCWWATRGACLFCGLSGTKRIYRSKAPAAVLRELRSRATDWPDARIDVVDNVVSDAFLDEILPELARDPLGVTFSFAVRPGVRREHVRWAAEAGAVLQCGVESLSDGVLRLMHKGARSLENVRLLKWCREYGVDLSWNMLYAVPGEAAEHYRQMTAMMPAVHFLPPPDACAPVVVERFSRYFDEPAAHGLGHLRPAGSYRYVYALDAAALENVAYFFEYEQPAEVDRPGYILRLRAQVRAWQDNHGAGELCSVSRPNSLELTDDRRHAQDVRACLTGADRRLYGACENIADFRSLCGLIGADPDLPGEADLARSRLAAFIERGWMVSDGDRYLSLAVQRGSGAPVAPPVGGADVL